MTQPEIREIIERTARRLLDEMHSGAHELPPGKPACLILWPDYIRDVQTAAAALATLTAAGSIAIATNSEHHNTLYSRYQPEIIDLSVNRNRSDLIDRLDRFDNILWLQPSIRSLADLAELNDNVYDVYVITQALLKACKVQVELGSMARTLDRHHRTENVLFSRIREMVDTVAKLGVTLYRYESPESARESADQPHTRAPLSNEAGQKKSIPPIIAKMLLAEKDILAQAELGVNRIRRDKNTIVTPLARDKARELGIELIE